MLERTYNIPLRKEMLKVPKYKRAKKAIKTVRNFLKRHMKCENVVLGNHINMKIHEHGRKNVCHHISVKVIKDNEKINNKEVEIARAELIGFEIEKPKPAKEKKKEQKKEEKETKEARGKEIKEARGKEIKEAHETKISAPQEQVLKEKLLDMVKEAHEAKEKEAEKEEHQIMHEKLKQHELNTNVHEKHMDKEKQIKESKSYQYTRAQKPKHERRASK